MQNFAFLKKATAVNVLTRCQIFSAKSSVAINDSINMFRDNLEQNKIFKKFIRGRVNTFAANYEYTLTNHRILLYMKKKIKIKAFPNVLKVLEWVHSILH